MTVVYLEKSDVGATLPTWLYCSTWMLYTAEKMGKVGYVHWPKKPNRSLIPFQDDAAFARCPNMYEWWFEQPCYTGPLPAPRDETWEWEHCPYLGKHGVLGQPLAGVKAYYQSRLRFNAATRKWIADLEAKYGLDLPNTIGVSWRGCDNVMDGRPRVPIEEYFPHLDRLLAAEPNLAIFATAEEEQVVDKIQARYPRVVVIPEFYSAPAGFKEHSDYRNPARGYDKGLQVCGMISLLSRCKHYVRNWSSQSCIANWMSNGNVINIRCGDLVRDV